MRKRIVIVVILALLLATCYCSLCFADFNDSTFSSENGAMRYQYIKQAKASITISNGIATVAAKVTPANGVSFTSAVMTIELVKSSSGLTIQSWSGTYYPDSTGSISFEDTQALYASGGYYVRVSGTVYTTGGAHEPFNATSATAVNSSISKELVAQLLENNVDIKEIDFLCEQVEIYGATSAMVSNYADGLIKNANSSEKAYSQKKYKLTEDESGIITENGIMPKIDPSATWNISSHNPESVGGEKGIASVSTVSDSPYGDSTGVYYVVNSTAGHNRMTAFATRPTITNAYINDRPYLMFAFYSTNYDNVVYGDIGLVYYPDTATWKGFYNIAYRYYDPYGNEQVPVINPGNWDEGREEDYTFSFTGGTNLYYELQIMDSPDKVKMTIRDATTWDTVCEIERPILLNSIPSDFSTVRIAKEVTLAQHNNGTLNSNSGTIVSNAQYSMTYLYTSSGTYYQFSPYYCYEAYRKGPGPTTYQKVIASPTPWTAETVYISFN